MKQKKIFAGALSAALILSLAACQSGGEGGQPAGGGGEGDAPEAVDNQHGDNRRREHAAQIQNQLWGMVPPVEEEKGQSPG